MKPFPHHYRAKATAASESVVTLSSLGVPPLESAPPSGFEGPGDKWSPESLLAAAVADCFVLTFRAIARASHLLWSHLECDAEGVLDRTDEGLRFTSFALEARLELPPGGDVEKARRLLEKAEHSCLISRSLNAATRLEAEIDVVTD